MISYSEAKKKVDNYLRNLDIACELLEDETIEWDLGWVFFYNSKEYIKTGNLSAVLVGNAPLIIDKFTGALVEMGTAFPIEYYIENYRGNR